MAIDVSRRSPDRNGFRFFADRAQYWASTQACGGDPPVQVESVRGIRLAAGRIPIAPHFKVRRRERLRGAKIHVAARNISICRRNRIFGTHRLPRALERVGFVSSVVCDLQGNRAGAREV